MPVAYSYKRFSNPSQATGDSLRRQTDLAERYCERHQLTLSQDSFEDLGVSGYSGANLQEGSALHAFLEAVQKGRIPPGSFLLIEAFDRLTRLTPDKALALLMSLMSAGITVVTLQDGQRFSAEDMAANMAPLLLSVVQLFVGHEESKRKSVRLSEVYKRKRETGDNRIRLPFWVGRDPSGNLFLKQSEAEVVRHIFELAARQGLGSRAIATRLNREGLLNPSGKPWAGSSVSKILTARSTFGEYVPHSAAMGTTRQPTGAPLPGFYPPVVDQSTFHKANRAKRAPGPKPTNSGPRNLFSAMVRCTCGQNLHFKRASKRDKLDRLFCPARCGAPSIPYEEFEAVTVLSFTEILHERIEGERSLEPPIDQVDARLEDIERRIANVVRAIEVGGNINELVTSLNDLKLQRAAIEEETNTALEDLEDELGGFTTWKAVAAQEYILQRDNPEYRRKLESVLRRWISGGQCLDGPNSGQVRWQITPSRRRLLGGIETRILPTQLGRPPQL